MKIDLSQLQMSEPKNFYKFLVKQMLVTKLDKTRNADSAFKKYTDLHPLNSLGR